MLSKEEYKKELIRMWDSVRDDNKGESSCYGVVCDDCALQHICNSYTQSNEVYHAVEMVETVETWSKENPIITNRDKFREIFGFEISHNGYDCLAIPCPDEFKAEASLCNSCPYNGFWSREYKEPKESEEIIDRDFSAIKRKCIVCPHCATCNISENPTNGDMIKAMFPYVEIKDNCDIYYSVNIENLSIDTGLNTVGFRKDWWNAPYKLESEE